MIPIDRRLARLTIVSTVLAALGAAAGWGAQDEPLVKAAKVQEKPHGLPPAPGQVDNWIFMGFRTAEAARSWVENMLNDQIEDVERSAGLSGPQGKKLALACQGEVKGFFDGVDAFRCRIGQFPVPWNNDHQQEVLRESESLRRDFGNQFAFGERSLFQKMIPRVLSGDQLARYEKALLDRRVFRYRAAVGWVAVLLVRTSDGARSNAMLRGGCSRRNPPSPEIPGLAGSRSRAVPDNARVGEEVETDLRRFAVAIARRGTQ